MYRKDYANQLQFEDFYLPFSGKLRSDNRWVVLSGQIPWKQIEQAYSALFSDSKVGCPAKSARIALGSLIIKERLGTTDRATGTDDKTVENVFAICSATPSRKNKKTGKNWKDR